VLDTRERFAEPIREFARARRGRGQAAEEHARKHSGSFSCSGNPNRPPRFRANTNHQQPFGGSRASGTNDKAGSILNLMRWISPRAIKETFVPPRDWRYPFLAKD
jgi:hypothetical protein